MLNPTPRILSVGKRCMREGFSFHWEAGKVPYFVSPSGSVIDLRVVDDIPYYAHRPKVLQPAMAAPTDPEDKDHIFLVGDEIWEFSKEPGAIRLRTLTKRKWAVHPQNVVDKDVLSKLDKRRVVVCDHGDKKLLLLMIAALRRVIGSPRNPVSATLCSLRRTLLLMICFLRILRKWNGNHQERIIASPPL